jgi:hypothetical protein
LNKASVFVLGVIALVLSGCASVPRPSEQSSVINRVRQPPYEIWARVLNQFVDSEGRVNFQAAAKDRADLNQFVAYVYDIGPNSHPELFPTKEHVVAYHINAYNALAMHKVIEEGVPQSLSGFKKISFFLFGPVRVGGESISLYRYENKVIRGLGEERVHVALNCMSVGCPRLPREPFLPTTLDEQLNRESKKFFNELRNVTLNDLTKVVTLSEILKFFPEDFLAKSPSLIAYVNRYRVVKVPEDFSVEFRDFDWTVNRQPGQ